MGEYLPVVVLAVLGFVFVLLSIVASRLLAPERPTRAKLAAYECGITDQAALPERMPVRFYLVAMLFIMFDIEIVFLYPWAVANTGLGLFGLLAMTLFVVVFFLSFVYEVASGGLEWGPIRRAAAPLVSVARQPAGVRTVGLTGRAEVASPLADVGH